SVILHITKREAWEQAQTEGSYRGDTLDTEGFIHCSTPEQVAATANNLFRARRNLVLLCIDPATVQPEIRWEEAENGQRYPHLYGPLNLDAVIKVVDFPPGLDGRFTLPQEVPKSL